MAELKEQVQQLMQINNA